MREDGRKYPPPPARMDMRAHKRAGKREERRHTRDGGEREKERITLSPLSMAMIMPCGAII